MRGIRIAWLVTALVAMLYAAWTAFGPAESASMAWGKFGALEMPNAPADATCNSPLYYAVGVWPLVVIGLALGGPPMIAALALRAWVSWAVVVTLGVVALLGVVQWPVVWGHLMFAIPLLVVAVIVASLQVVLAQYDAGRTAVGECAKL
ncbi:hypothetical protein [Gordonia iterans]